MFATVSRGSKCLIGGLCDSVLVRCNLAKRHSSIKKYQIGIYNSTGKALKRVTWQWQGKILLKLYKLCANKKNYYIGRYITAMHMWYIDLATPLIYLCSDIINLNWMKLILKIICGCWRTIAIFFIDIIPLHNCVPPSKQYRILLYWITSPVGYKYSSINHVYASYSISRSHIYINEHICTG